MRDTVLSSIPVSSGCRRRGRCSDPLGVIEVQEIIGARLSSVRVLEARNSRRAGDRLKTLEIDTE
ncbi:MAG TPA: hypothetical protein EYM39_10345 [Candidatus Latescibacteria bacterium]|nr:hypothetical protein [Candidatus Latescibacterota bacterium]